MQTPAGNLLALIALIVVLYFFVRSRRPKVPDSGRQAANVTVASPNLQSAQRAASEKSFAVQARDHFAKGGMSPDSTLRCMIQTGGPTPDFLDGLVGSYRSGKFLRILMQNDERDDPRGYWHSWDVPWSQLVEVILRSRTTPHVGTDTRQPDGTYARKGSYLQTRLYKVGRGIECRLLDPDGGDMEAGAPYQWLKSNVLDGGVRFSKDTQGNPQYGDDGEDQLDEYALHLESREKRETDEVAAKRAAALSSNEISALMAARPEKVRTHFASQKYSDALARRIEAIRNRQGSITQTHIDHVRLVIELAFAGAISRSYSEMFFYVYFPKSEASTSAKVKADLVGVVRLMLQELPYFESS